jgi:hypothetical protein
MADKRTEILLTFVENACHMSFEPHHHDGVSARKRLVECQTSADASVWKEEAV